MLDSYSGDPVEGAEVRIGATDLSARTDDEGRFFIALSDLPSDGTVVVSADNYPGATILDLNGLIYAGAGNRTPDPVAKRPKRATTCSPRSGAVRFNPLVALRMGLSQRHYPVGVERAETDCPELDEAAIAAAQAMRLRLRPGEEQNGEYAYLLIGCGSLRGEGVGAWATPMFDNPQWIEHQVENSRSRSDEQPHVLFKSDISSDRRFVSPTVLHSGCPARNDAALAFVTGQMNLMPSATQPWMDYRDDLPPMIAIGSVPCSYLTE